MAGGGLGRFGALLPHSCVLVPSAPAPGLPAGQGLPAITEILDSTDDETLSPFDTIMDAELLTSLRERENPSVSGGASPSTQSALLSLQVWGLVGWGIHRRLRSTMPICTANLG